MSEEKFWNNCYINQDMGWDAGGSTPPIAEYIDTLAQKDMAILIPGAGNAYEAEYLLHKGFTNVTVVDISSVVIESNRKKFAQKYSSGYALLHEDFFKHEGSYDLIFEQTFFCAIAPSKRDEYVRKMNSLLKPTGKLVGVLFNREFEPPGPPFGGTKEEYLQLFEPYFHVQKMELCRNSIGPRERNELFFIATPKAL